jgi:hypothetical protein
VRSPQVIARCSTALPPNLPPQAYQSISLSYVCAEAVLPVDGVVAIATAKCASSSHHVGLLFGSCPSARGFPIAFLHAVGRPSALGLWWWFLHFIVWYFHRGLEPHLQRAHAGHTQRRVAKPQFRGFLDDSKSMGTEARIRVLTLNCVLPFVLRMCTSVRQTAKSHKNSCPKKKCKLTEPSSTNKASPSESLS